MSKIILLDESTINKIAAGEVIEKPASIVKELVENSIDAGSTSITIEIKDGGKSYISVSDNGSGISEEDLEHVFLRHATSKIHSANDLLSINTLGFRGEAMASIAAVSEVELQTKAEDDDSGSYMLVRGGKIIERKSMGLPTGTGIIVRNLFYNTPARLKFLKSDTSEQGHIVDMVEKLALTNTGISIKLIVNGKTALQTPGNGDLLSVIQCVYGRNVAKSMLLLDYDSEVVKIDGYIGKPEISKGNSTYMIFSVNNRIIKNRMLGEAVKQAYKTLLMNNRYPFSILNINIDSERIDVNVHPTKQEIKFSDDRAIFNTIYIAVKNCLNSSQLFYGDVGSEEEQSNINEHVNPYTPPNEQSQGLFTTKSPGYDKNRAYEGDMPLLKEIESREPFVSNPASMTKPYGETKHTREQPDFSMPKTDYRKNAPETEGKNDELLSLNIIGQLFSTYILCQGRDKFYLIDQHAAHERIMYEHLMSRFDTGDIPVQQLMLPIVIELSPTEAQLLNANLTVFYRLGFEIEQFGENTIAIRSIPIIMGEPCTGEFFSDILASIGNNGKQAENPKEKIIISMSCKNAIKAGQLLSQDEIRELLVKLANTKSPYTCPHGRPTTVIMDQYELEKKFKRIV